MTYAYKILREDSGKLVSTVRVPSFMTVNYKPNEWVSGINDTPVFVFNTKEKGLEGFGYLRDGSRLLDDITWLVVVEVDRVDRIENAIGVWNYTENDNAYADNLINSMTKFWERFKNARKRGRQVSSYHANFPGWGGIYLINQHVANRVRVVEPVMIHDGLGRRYPKQADLDRVNWKPEGWSL